jgi:integrase
MRLTESGIKSAKPGEKLRKLSDGGGLQLWIMPNGSKLWRHAYRFGGKQKLLSLGSYPETGLRAAREARLALARQLREGVDPSEARKDAKAAKVEAAANSFGGVADEWFAKKLREGKSEATLTKLRWLVDFARPDLGRRPVSTIRPKDVLPILQAIERRGRRETARRLRATLGEIFRFAVATGRAEDDPTAALRGAIAAPVVTPRAAIVKPAEFGALLRAVDDYQGQPETRLALQLLALTFVRPGELRGAEWQEIDADAAVWNIPPARMKMRRPHRVPLARQSLAILADLRMLTGRGQLLFPSIRSAQRAMSENTLNAALRRLGFAKDAMSAHGFRAAASTLLNESGKWNPDAIEAQLAHVDGNDVRRAYQRAEFWDERVKMMQAWADRLDALRTGATVHKLRKSAGDPAG